MVISQSLAPPSVPARLPAQLSTVSGISSSDEAKIGGITPAVLSLIGRCERSCCIPRDGLPLGILDQHPALRPLHEADEQDQRDASAR